MAICSLILHKASDRGPGVGTPGPANQERELWEQHITPQNQALFAQQELSRLQLGIREVSLHLPKLVERNSCTFLATGNQRAVKSEGGKAPPCPLLAWTPLTQRSWVRCMEQTEARDSGCSRLFCDILLLSSEPRADSLLQLLEGLLEVGPGGILLITAPLAGGCARTQKVILTVGIRSDCSRQLL